MYHSYSKIRFFQMMILNTYEYSGTHFVRPSLFHQKSGHLRGVASIHSCLNFHSQWGSNRTNNIDGAEAVWLSHNSILVTRMPLATIALLCKQTSDYFRNRPPPNAQWRHLLGNRLLFVPHWPFQRVGLSSVWPLKVVPM